MGNYASRYYRYAIQSVRALQHALEAELYAQVRALEQEWMSQRKSDVSALTAFTVNQGQRVSNAWRDFYPLLVTQYRDGMVITALNESNVAISRKFYPKNWLTAVGYFSTPPNSNPDAILFASQPSWTTTTTTSVWIYVLSMSCTLFLGMVLGYWWNLIQGKRFDWTFRGQTAAWRNYEPIPGWDEVDREMVPFAKQLPSHTTQP